MFGDKGAPDPLAATTSDTDTLLAELRASRARLALASTEARRRVERDLHDGAQQNLVLLQLKLAMVREHIEHDPEEAATLLDESRLDLDTAVAQLRDLARGIYPQILASGGLGPALAELASKCAIRTTGELGSIGRYHAEVEAAIYFCCAEALQNASKHAGRGSRASLRLFERDGHLHFHVSDDGRGFDTCKTKAGSGIENISDRIGALGGEVAIESRPNFGTRVRGRVPVS